MTLNTESLMDGSSKDVIVSIDDWQLTTKNAVCTNIDFNMSCGAVEEVPCFGGFIDKVSPREPAELTLTFMIPLTDVNGGANIMTSWFTESPKIGNRKVKDCSIQELLFAVRSKVNG